VSIIITGNRGRLAKEIIKQNDKLDFVGIDIDNCDITDKFEFISYFEKLLKEVRDIDLVIHCAEQNNTKGIYAMYGGGEYEIPNIWYFPDYINFDLKLIIECDEKRHFDENGNLLEKDIQRQKEIQEHFPDFTFRRIEEHLVNPKNRPVYL